jgi:single-strand DNA-binding protein
MFSLNRTQLIGYVTQPVELRQTPEGQSVANLNVAVPYSFQAADGQTLTGTSYHSVTVWNALAEVAAQYVRPGSQVFLAGRLQTDSWEDRLSGEKRSRTIIVALEMILLDPREGQVELDATAKNLAGCLNRVDLIGNLTRDPELRTTTSGQQVVSLRLATNERWKDRATSELRERAEYHSVIAWGELAQRTATHLRKGQRLHVAGRVQTRSWETQAGTKRTTTEVIAETVSLLGVQNREITYTHETRAERLASRRATEEPRSPSLTPSPAPESPDPGLDMPPLKYEPEIRVEDLPF